MKRYEMIKDKKHFNDIIRKGHYIKDNNYVIYYVNNLENKYTHFGIAIKNSIGHAVARNRLKRQTRMIIDDNKKLFDIKKDYIIMIRNTILDSDFHSMNESINSLLKGIH